MTVPRTILLPAPNNPLTGTTVNGVAQPTTVPVLENQIGAMYVDGSNNATICTLNSTNVYAVNCSTAANAFAFLQAIKNFLFSHSQGVFKPVAS